MDGTETNGAAAVPREAGATPPTPSTPVEAEPGPFRPEDGPVVLIVSPVAGFQGLMRLQDAVARVGGVNEADVEAYSDGEARLRMRLSGPVVAQSVADTLGDVLGQRATLALASAADRSLFVTLEPLSAGASP